jgi:hypothetical protein
VFDTAQRQYVLLYAERKRLMQSSFKKLLGQKQDAEWAEQLRRKHFSMFGLEYGEEKHAVASRSSVKLSVKNHQLTIVMKAGKRLKTDYSFLLRYVSASGKCVNIYTYTNVEVGNMYGRRNQNIRCC